MRQIAYSCGLNVEAESSPFLITLHWPPMFSFTIVLRCKHKVPVPWEPVSFFFSPPEGSTKSWVAGGCRERERLRVSGQHLVGIQVLRLFQTRQLFLLIRLLFLALEYRVCREEGLCGSVFLNVLFVNVPEHDCSCYLACKGGCSGPIFIHLFCAFNNVHANKILMLSEVSSIGGFYSVAAYMHLHGLSQI